MPSAVLAARADAAPMPVRRRRRWLSPEAASAALLAGPAVVLMAVLLFGPALGVCVLALTSWEFGASSLRFIGLGNFVALAADPVFWIALTNTLLYAAIVVPGSTALGLAVALLIESGRRFRAFYRVAHFLPVMSTLAAMAIVWDVMLHPTIGLVNHLLGLIGIAGPNWLRDPRTVVPTLAMIGIWQNLGFAMVLFLAGLKTIPRDLYDAAAVDGADRRLDRLRTVTLPQLGPVMMFVLVVVAIRAFQVFDTVKILTQGGPNKASEMLLHRLYVEGFEFLRTGYGAAITVVFLLIIMALTLAQARLLDRRVHYS
jgi:multiple sugar transport system permease protein